MPKIIALEKQIKGLTDKYEASEKARQDEIQKRTDSEISAQTIAALTKANCTDAQTFSKLVAGQINVQDDGSGAGAGNVGDGNTQVYQSIQSHCTSRINYIRKDPNESF